MKKIVILVSFLLFSLPLFSQNVRYIKLTDNFWEFMTIDEPYTPKGERSFNIAFQVCDYINEPNPDDRLAFYLILTFNEPSYSSLRIPNGGNLLIKTGKGEIISSVNEADESIPAYSPSNGAVKDIPCHQVDNTVNKCYIRGLYKLLPEDLSKMESDGVIKIRVETNGDNIDVNLPLEEQIKIGKKKIVDNKFSISVRTLYLLIQDVYNPLKNF